MNPISYIENLVKQFEREKGMFSPRTIGYMELEVLFTWKLKNRLNELRICDFCSLLVHDNEFVRKAAIEVYDSRINKKVKEFKTYATKQRFRH